jgi:hypothetical protein
MEGSHPPSLRLRVSFFGNTTKFFGNMNITVYFLLLYILLLYIWKYVYYRIFLIWTGNVFFGLLLFKFTQAQIYG